MSNEFPKVTPNDLANVIANEHYFTAAEGTHGANDVHHPAVGIDHPLNLVTICTLTLINGYTIVGTSACVDARNFDKGLGRTLARQEAVEQLWPLMGFLLKDRVNGNMLKFEKL